MRDGLKKVSKFLVCDVFVVTIVLRILHEDNLNTAFNKQRYNNDSCKVNLFLH